MRWAYVNEEIGDVLMGVDAIDQREVDRLMIEADGTAEQGASSAPTPSWGLLWPWPGRPPTR